LKKFFDIKVRDEEEDLPREKVFEVPEEERVAQSDTSEFWSEGVFKKHETPEKKKIRRKINYHALKSSFLRGLSVFAILLISLAFFYVKGVDAKGEVEKRVESAKINLNFAVENLDKGDLGEASVNIEKAREDLRVIKVNAQSWGQDVQYFGLMAPKKSKAMELEEFLNLCDQILVNVVDLQQVLSLTMNQNQDLATLGDGEEANIDLLGLSNSLLLGVSEAEEKIDESARLLKRLEGSEFIGEEDFSKLSRKIQSLASSMKYTSEILETDMPWLSAKGGERNILILFQNNTEIRPSGGFLGSFGVLRFKDGVLQKIDFQKNIYSLDKEFLADNHIDSPGELITTTGNWSMVNSNWWLNSPDAFREVMRFYELESGDSVDGVIALDTTLFLDLLAKVGPIEMPEYGLTVTDQNFLKDVQYEVEIGYFERDEGAEENEPKKMLAEMMPKFLDRFFAGLKDSDKAFEILNSIGKGLTEKHLLFYMEKEDFQARLNELNYTGALRESRGDYLYVTSTNIGGLKSSLNIEEEIALNSSISREGLVLDELTITRKHAGSYDWPDGINKNYMRVLLPASAENINFEAVSGNFERRYDLGFKNDSKYWVDEEGGYTRVNFWMNTEPGNTSSVKIRYQFKPEDAENYQAVFQKQPGLIGSKMTYTFTLPSGQKFNSTNSNMLEKTFDLKKDTIFRLNLN